MSPSASALQERTNLVGAIAKSWRRKGNAHATKATRPDSDNRSKLTTATEAPGANVASHPPTTTSQDPPAEAKGPEIQMQEAPSPAEPTAEPDPELASLQILLLEKAVDLVKSHATEAASNLARLKSLMADEEPPLSSPSPLQRERWLEERRELNATRALWGSFQYLEAIVAEDESYFEHQRTAEDRRRAWDEMQRRSDADGSTFYETDEGQGSFYILAKSRRQRKPKSLVLPTLPSEPPLASAVSNLVPLVNQRSALLPLKLASKADPDALLRNPTNRVCSSSGSSAGSSVDSELRTPSTIARPLDPVYVEEVHDGTSGTVTIFRSSDAVNSLATSDDSEDSEKLSQKLPPPAEDVQVAMPDYVADLMSEFDAHSTVPALALLSPSTSDFSMISPQSLSSPTMLPQSAPTSPIQGHRRALHKAPSRRFHGLFKHQSMQFSSPYSALSTQIPSRLGSSIDLVIPEDRPFSLDLELANLGSGSQTRQKPFTAGPSPLDLDLSAINPKSLSSESASSSQTSLMSGHGISLADPSSQVPASAPATSSAPTEFTVPPTTAKSVDAEHPPTPGGTDHGKGFSSRLKKRISAIRFSSS